MTNKIRYAFAAALATVAACAALALGGSPEAAHADPAPQAVRTADMVATSTPAPAVEETVIVLPVIKIVGQRPAKVAAKPAKKPCRETNEGSRPLLSDYQGTVRSFTFCN